MRREIQDANNEYPILVLLPLGADRVGRLSRTMSLQDGHAATCIDMGADDVVVGAWCGG